MKKRFDMHSVSKLIIMLVMATSAFCVTVAGQSKSDSDPLKPYTTCKLPGDLNVREVTRRPKSIKKFREVPTAKGTEKVSVVDGYRVMFAYKDLFYFFANVKIEESEPASYLQDKAKVISNLEYSASTEKATAMISTGKTMLNGFEHYGTDRDKIDVGGTIGIHVLFYDANNLIVTIYLLNQDDKTSGSLFSRNGKRRFTNIAEYQALRDDFLSRYSECLKGVADAQH
jgi:hypothetical protein